MDPKVAIVPSAESDFLFLSRTPQGRLFKKHILTKGELIHPTTKQKLTIDDDFIASLKRNFDSKVCPIVQVPLANKNNEHSEEPDRNIGEVIDLTEEDGKIYAMIDARKTEYAEELGKTLLGASAYISLDYTDTKTDAHVGPTLLHTCITNRPYVTDLDDFQEIVAASADTVGEALLFTEAPTVEPPILAEPAASKPAEAAKSMTKEELIAQLKTEHGVDVEALTEQAGVAQAVTAAKAELTHALTQHLTSAGVMALSNTDGAEDKVTTDDVIGAVAELAQTNMALTSRVGTLEHKDAENEVDKLIVEGKVLPAKRDVMVELRLTNSDVFQKLIPEAPIVKLDVEQGSTQIEDESHKKSLDDELMRLTNENPQIFGKK